MARELDDAMRKKLRAVDEPIRMRLLQKLERGGEWTAKELADAIRAGANGLYYHLKILEDAGFIQSAGARVVGRQHERLYCAAPEEDRLLLWDLSDPVQYAKHLTSLLEVAKFDVEEAVFEQAAAIEAGTPRPLRALVQSPEITTTADEVWEFHKRLTALLTEFRDRAKKSKKKSDPRVLKLTYAIRERPVEVIPG